MPGTARKLVLDLKVAVEESRASTFPTGLDQALDPSERQAARAKLLVDAQLAFLKYAIHEGR